MSTQLSDLPSLCLLLPRNETENRKGHPGPWIPSSAAPPHNSLVIGGLGFVPALFKQEGQLRAPLSYSPADGNAYHEIGIFKSFCGYLEILSHYSHFLFDNSFWRAFCNPGQYCWQQ